MRLDRLAGPWPLPDGLPFHLLVEAPKEDLVAGTEWSLGTHMGRFHRRHKISSTRGQRERQGVRRAARRNGRPSAGIALGGRRVESRTAGAGLAVLGKAAIRSGTIGERGGEGGAVGACRSPETALDRERVGEVAQGQSWEDAYRLAAAATQTSKRDAARWKTRTSSRKQRCAVESRHVARSIRVAP